MFFDEFTKSQLTSWPLARNNYERLRNVIYRTIDFEGFQIRIQHNPDRIQSAVAKIDEQSIRARACFLCKGNIPPEQASFDRHYTVPAKHHIPQLIKGHFQDMLAIAQTYSEYTIFYNGPRSGASAPDHFHFQLAARHIMPLETDVNSCPKEILWISESREATIESIHHYLRKNIILHSNNREQLIAIFEQLVSLVGQITPNDPEPMMNLFAWYENNEWWVVIFPRRQHRPWQFFAEEDENILFSPGCVDFAGLIISPREKDFNRLDAPLLEELFSQLTLTDEQFENLRFMIYDL